MNFKVTLPSTKLKKLKQTTLVSGIEKIFETELLNSDCVRLL